MAQLTGPARADPAPETGALLAVHDDGGLTVEDHVETGPGQALAEHALPLGVAHLLEGVDDGFELRRRQVAEQPEPGDRVDEFVRAGHPAHRATPASHALA